MDYKFISETQLFSGADEKETERIINSAGAYTRHYGKEEIILREGTIVSAAAIVLSGRVRIEQIDVWGNRNIISYVLPGEMFAESYACARDVVLMVDVSAAEPSEILFMDINRLIGSDNIMLVKNLLSIAAEKNINLSRKITHTAAKTKRGRVLSFLSDTALQKGSRSFTIPLSRQQMADYLCVDRSALSNELSKMASEGLIEYKKNRFVILDND